MQIEILSAIIGASGTLFTGLATSPLLSKMFVEKNKNKYYIKNSTFKKSLEVEWMGKNIQKKGISGENMEVFLKTNFKIKRKKITGLITIRWYECSNEYQTNLSFEGGFISNSYIQLLYKSENENIENFGVSFFKINSSGSQLIGAMIGYGHRKEEIIQGEIKLNKVN